MELLVAAAVGTVVAAAAGDLMLSNMRSGAALEATQRLRTDWSRTSHFIESEVALSERVITDASLLNLAQCTTTISAAEFKFGLEVRRDLPPAIYFVKSNAANSLEWTGDSSLWRCGPSINENGEYTNVIRGSSTSLLTAQRLVDGLKVNVPVSEECTLSVTPSQDGVSKSLKYELCMSGLTKYKYAQSVNTYSRISPVFSYPNTNSLCSDEFLTIEGFYKLEGGTTSADLLELPSTGLSQYDDILICGYGGGDTIKGSTANDVLEAGDSGSSNENGATIYAYSGSDRLVGGPGNDQLDGGDGDDVLISGAGNDILNGGSGDNQYLAGAGKNFVIGGTGLDVVFLDQSKADVSGLANCSRSSCLVTYSVDGLSSQISATEIEVIIFRDGRYDITS
ncbi:RTX toxins and related Ca2+-binding protein [Synechococcus sp. WH 7805]|nr:RTX toxins and related Ca2+-binding protein [Synechococcus sp. WH 7805]